MSPCWAAGSGKNHPFLGLSSSLSLSLFACLRLTYRSGRSYSTPDAAHAANFDPRGAGLGSVNDFNLSDVHLQDEHCLTCWAREALGDDARNEDR